MFSSKTSELIIRYNRYTIGGKKCVMVKYKNDTRYHEEKIATHDKKLLDALVCEYLYQIDNMIKDYDVILIDEIQFYKDAHIFCDKWANEGFIVDACGLNGTFDRKPFLVINKLIPLVDNITFLKAVCKETGNDATFSKLSINGNEIFIKDHELIGGEEMYHSVDRITYFKSTSDMKNDIKNKIKEFCEIYCSIINIEINDKINKYIEQLSEDANNNILPFEFVINSLNNYKNNLEENH